MQDSDHYDSDSDWDKMITPEELTRHVNKTLQVQRSPPGTPLRRGSPARKTTSPLAGRRGGKTPSPARIGCSSKTSPATAVATAPAVASGSKFEKRSEEPTDVDADDKEDLDSSTGTDDHPRPFSQSVLSDGHGGDNADDVCEQLVGEMQQLRTLCSLQQDSIRKLESEKMDALQALSSVNGVCNNLRNRQVELDIEVQDLTGMLRLKEELVQTKDVRLKQLDQVVRMLRKRVGDLEAQHNGDSRELGFLRVKIQQQSEYIAHLSSSAKRVSQSTTTTAAAAANRAAVPVRSVPQPLWEPDSASVPMAGTYPETCGATVSSSQQATPLRQRRRQMEAGPGLGDDKPSQNGGGGATVASVAEDVPSPHGSTEEWGDKETLSEETPRHQLSKADQRLLELRNQMRRYIAQDKAMEAGGACNDGDFEGAADTETAEDTVWLASTPDAAPSSDASRAGVSTSTSGSYGNVKAGLILGSPANELIRQNVVRTHYQEFSGVDEVTDPPRERPGQLQLELEVEDIAEGPSGAEGVEPGLVCRPPITCELIKGTPANELIRQNLVRAQYQQYNPRAQQASVRSEPQSPAPLTVSRNISNSASQTPTRELTWNEKIRQNNILAHRLPSPAITNPIIPPRSRPGTPVRSPAVAARQAAAEAAHQQKLRGGGSVSRSAPVDSLRSAPARASTPALASPLVAFMRKEGRDVRPSTPSQQRTRPSTPSSTSTRPSSSFNSSSGGAFNSGNFSSRPLSAGRSGRGPAVGAVGGTSRDSVETHVLSHLIGRVDPNEVIRQNIARSRANYM